MSPPYKNNLIDAYFAMEALGDFFNIAIYDKFRDDLLKLIRHYFEYEDIVSKRVEFIGILSYKIKTNYGTNNILYKEYYRIEDISGIYSDIKK